MNTCTLLASTMVLICITTISMEANATNLHTGNYDYVISTYACDSDDFLIQLKSAGWVDVKTSVVGPVAANWIIQLAQELALSGKQTGYFTVNWSAGLVICDLPDAQGNPTPIATAPVVFFTATANP